MLAKDEIKDCSAMREEESKGEKRDSVRDDKYFMSTQTEQVLTGDIFCDPSLTQEFIEEVEDVLPRCTSFLPGHLSEVGRAIIQVHPVNAFGEQGQHTLTENTYIIIYSHAIADYEMRNLLYVYYKLKFCHIKNLLCSKSTKK